MVLSWPGHRALDTLNQSPYQALNGHLTFLSDDLDAKEGGVGVRVQKVFELYRIDENRFLEELVELSVNQKELDRT